MKDSKDYSQRKVVVIPSAALTQINFTEVLETSAATSAMSVDESLAFVRYNNVMPASVESIESRVEYSVEDFRSVLKSSAWTDDVDEPEDD